METAVATVLSKIDGITALKEEQLTALEGVLEGKDVFALLPTGYGKSLIFQIAPLVAELQDCTDWLKLKVHHAKGGTMGGTRATV